MPKRSLIEELCRGRRPVPLCMLLSAWMPEIVACLNSRTACLFGAWPQCRYLVTEERTVMTIENGSVPQLHISSCDDVLPDRLLRDVGGLRRK